MFLHRLTLRSVIVENTSSMNVCVCWLCGIDIVYYSHTLAQRHTYLYTTIDFDMATTNTGKWQMMAIMHRFALIKNHRARKRTAEMRRVSADESSQRCDDAVIFYGPLQRTCITGMWYVCVCVETSVTKDNHAMMPLEHKCVYTMLWYNFGVVLPMTRTP